MDPLISIIVPIYNVEPYLKRCVESLLNQTLSNIEIILVDDESPDKCPQICDEHARNDSRIKVIHKKNEGLGLARNSGLEIATGKYIMFVDSDDHIKFDACETLYNTALKYNADVVTGNFIIESRPGTWIENKANSTRIYKGKEIRSYMLDMIASAPHIKIERLHPVSACLLLIRKTIIKDNDIRFKSEREVASEDTLFKIDLLNHINILVESPYNFYYYHLNNTSLSHTFKEKDFEKLFTLHEFLIEYVGSDKESIERINRFIISDIRIQILRLVISKRKDKIKILKWMLNHKIWDKLKNYSPNNYPIYPQLIYRLCLYNMPYTLFCIAHIIVIIKKHMK